MRLRKAFLLGILVFVVIFTTVTSFARVRVMVRPFLPRAVVVAPPPPAVIIRPVPKPVGPAGYLELNVAPRDSDVYVDGKFMGKSSRFAGSAEYISVTHGKHSVSLRREGFITQNFVIDVKAGKIVELDVTLKLLNKVTEKEPPAPTYEVNTSGTGTLSFNVEPADATLYINGNFQGAVSEFSSTGAPLILRAGKHTLDIVKPGYESYSLTTEVGKDKEKEIVIKLKKQG